ncbi:MAG: phospholipase D-like domain-containing protein, partial [Gammaproteobacteria bacterium]|nr:phospholipase D-like domain-containing protein [Gammaproteobacteria bacterium]
SLNDSPIVEKLRDWSFDFDWGEAEVLYDDPAKITAKRDRTELMLSAQLNPYLDRVKQELLIFSAYFVPGKDGVALLKKLRQRGVRVRVITNSLASTDVAIVHAGYARYRWELLKAGVELYEVDRTLSRLERKEKKAGVGSSKASLHAKAFVIDRERAFIGSLNFDPRSVIENTELGLMIESPAIAIEMTDWFDEIAEQASFRVGIGLDHNGDKRLRWYRQRNGQQDVYITEPNTSFWRRLGVHLMRLLPIESHL